jgi:hypothetical protein
MKKFSSFKIEKNRLIKEDVESLSPEIMATMQLGARNPNTMPSVPTVSKSEPAKFISKLFESREMAHIYHLQVKNEGSFAAHKALQEYYEGILDIIDELIETYQGQYDIIENYDIIDTNGTKSVDKIQYFIDLAEFIKSTRKVAFLQEDSHLQNIIDEVVALIYRTLYKLKNLK